MGDTASKEEEVRQLAQIGQKLYTEINSKLSVFRRRNLRASYILLPPWGLVALSAYGTAASIETVIYRQLYIWTFDKVPIIIVGADAAVVMKGRFDIVIHADDVEMLDINLTSAW